MTTPLTSITPEGPVRGGVVVIQEAFGVTGHIVDVCRRFAAAGYHAVAPHLFHRSGDPVLEYDDMTSAMSLIGELTAAHIDEDVDGAVAALSAASIDLRNTAIVGFCMGGTVAFHTATRLDLGAAASSTAVASRTDASDIHRNSTSPGSSERRGSACSATATRGFRPRKSRSCAPRSPTPRWTPTSSATPKPNTASTATTVPPCTTRRPPATDGYERCSGSAPTSPQPTDGVAAGRVREVYAGAVFVDH